MDIDNFGRTILIDRSTRAAILTTKYSEICKFVAGCILDTHTIQISDTKLNKIDPTLSADLYNDEKWIIQLPGPIFQPLTDDSVLEILKEKRERAKLLQRGYYILLEQTSAIETLFDSMSDLSSFDLPMFIMNKEKYIEAFSLARTISFEEAEKHLNFLSESLLSVHLRKKSLFWKYSNTLRSVKNNNDFDIWLHSLLTETLYLGRV